MELGKKYNLNRPSLVVGRSSKCDIQIDQESVSRNHSKIVNTGKSILIRDIGRPTAPTSTTSSSTNTCCATATSSRSAARIFKFLSGGNIENAYHEEIYRLTTSTA